MRTLLTATGYTYNSAGQRTALTREDGTGDSFGYDNNRQVTAGCQASPLLYCPNNPNTRGQMAVFLTRTFGLQ